MVCSCGRWRLLVYVCCALVVVATQFCETRGRGKTKRDVSKGLGGSGRSSLPGFARFFWPFFFFFCFSRFFLSFQSDFPLGLEKERVAGVTVNCYTREWYVIVLQEVVGTGAKDECRRSGEEIAG